jgi:hypothetical protein
MTNKPDYGSIGWIDLTCDNADEVRDFYSAVIGWEAASVEMGDYEDYCMMQEDSDNPLTGICHKRGENAEIPTQWLIYITVEDLMKSVAKCLELGGKTLTEPRFTDGQGGFCVIQDPAGAVCALYQPEVD